MQGLLKEALIAKLSGIAKWRNEKEMWWRNYTFEWCEDKVIVRRYWDDDQLQCKYECKNGMLDGKIVAYREDGRIWWEESYNKGMPHGPCIDYFSDHTVILEYVRGRIKNSEVKYFS